MLAGVLAVVQLEGHVLQPFLLGRAVRVHPLAVVLVITGGALVAGIPGALFAVPLTAVANVVTGYLARVSRGESPGGAAGEAEPPAVVAGGVETEPVGVETEPVGVETEPGGVETEPVGPAGTGSGTRGTTVPEA
jgi:hypothetical protein